METILFTIRKAGTELIEIATIDQEILRRQAEKRRGMFVANDIIAAQRCFPDDPKYTFSNGTWGFPVPRTTARNPHYYIFATNCPDGATHAVKANLLGEKRRYRVDENTNLSDRSPLRAKDWFFARSELPQVREDLLITNNYLQMTFLQAKTFISKKVIVIEDSPLADTSGDRLTEAEMFNNG